MVTDKLTATHNFLEELAKHAGKANFMPANEIGKALQCLENKGIPNNKNEDYKYCNIEAILRKDFKNITGKENSFSGDELKKQYAIENAYNVFVVNGKLTGEVPENIIIQNIDKSPTEILKAHIAKYAQSDADAMIALNAAYADRGVFIHITKSMDKPVVLHQVNSSEGNLFFNVRNLIVIGKNVEVQLAEFYHASNGNYFSNNVTEIFIDEDARVNHTMVQNSGEASRLLHSTKVHQEKQSVYTNNTFTFSGALVRNNLSTAISAEFADANLFGLLVANGSQLVDNHTLVDHLKPNCQSNELYKGIANGKSTAIFNGQIFVERDAQKTNAYQSSKNILLSDDATVNAKPELEIYANDVKCSHGTSTGKVDENALFYLKARGIGEAKARVLLLQAFAYEVIDKLPNNIIKEKVVELFEHTLH
jgi:Fe-S cluster assembly protein SufD